MTETPANTPKPIGNTSNFFPGGSNGAAAPAFSAPADGEEAGDGEPEDSGKGRGVDENEGEGSVDVSVLSGCEVATGVCTEESPPVLVPSGGDVGSG